MHDVFTIDRVPFEVRLAETIHYCAPRANPANPIGCLRIKELRPYPHTRDRGESVVHVAMLRHSIYEPREPEKCIQWLEDTGVKARPELRRFLL